MPHDLKKEQKFLHENCLTSFLFHSGSPMTVVQMMQTVSCSCMFSFVANSLSSAMISLWDLPSDRLSENSCCNSFFACCWYWSLYSFRISSRPFSWNKKINERYCFFSPTVFDVFETKQVFYLEGLPEVGLRLVAVGHEAHQMGLDVGFFDRRIEGGDSLVLTPPDEHVDEEVERQVVFDQMRVAQDGH